MEKFFQASALVLVGVILALNQQSKSFSTLLTLGICTLILLLGIYFLEPMMTFLNELQALGDLQNEMMKILLKVTLISMLTQIVVTLCADSGNASMAQSLQFLSAAAILWLSIPVFRALLTLVQRILEGI